MTAGLPGTGIGGLYYFLLVLWMPFHEIGLVLRGRRSVPRLGAIAAHGSLVSGILAALWAEAWLLERVLLWAAIRLPAGSYWDSAILGAVSSLTPVAATWATFGVLGGVLLATQILRSWAWALSRRAQTVSTSEAGRVRAIVSLPDIRPEITR